MKLWSRHFENPSDLVDFVNENHIEKENIAAICTRSGNFTYEYALFYWSDQLYI